MIRIVTILLLLLLTTIRNSKPSSLKARTLSSTRLKRSAQSTDVDEFQQYLKPILRSRVPGSEGHSEVKKYIINFFKDINWDVKLDEFSQLTVIGQKQFTNIIATANHNAKKKLLLTAHYDSKLMKKLSDGTEFVAATDSAVPCAMMMSIAKNLDLEALKKNNDFTLEIVFFDGEEAFKQWSENDSIYGSRHLAESWSQPSNGQTYLQSVEALILLDLIGEKNPKFYSGFMETHPLFERLHFIETRLRERNLIKSKSAYFVNSLLNQPLGVEDDHIPFLTRGVPILHVIPIPFPKCWHKMCDDKNNIDMDTIHDLLKIFQIFFKEMLRL